MLHENRLRNAFQPVASFTAAIRQTLRRNCAVGHRKRGRKGLPVRQLALRPPAIAASGQYLEDRLLLTDFTGIGTFAQQQLQSFETTTFATSVVNETLPVIGATLANNAASNSLFAEVATAFASIADNTANRSTVRTNFEAALTTAGFTNVNVSDNSDDSFTLQFEDAQTISVGAFNSGLAILPISSSAAFDIELTATFDLTVGIDGAGDPFFNAGATGREIVLGASVPSTSLPTLDISLGPLSASATPVGSSDPALEIQFDVDVTGGVVQSLANVSVATDISGSASVKSALVVDLTVGGISPKLSSDFSLEWNFGPTATDPIIKFSAVQLEVGGLLDGFGGSAVRNILEQARPVFQIAKQFDEQLPGLDRIAAEVEGLVGDLSKVKTGVAELDAMLLAFADPDLINILNAGAVFLRSNPFGDMQENKDNADAIEQFTAAVVTINEISDFVDQFDLRKGLVIDIGSFELGGGSVDLKGATGALFAMTPSVEQPMKSINTQDGVSDFQKFLDDNYLKTDLLDPLSVFQLLAGSPNITIVEYDNDIAPINLTGIQIVSQNFAIGIIPANFNISASLDLDPHLKFGFSSRGLTEKSIAKGIYVGAGLPGNTAVGDFSFLELIGTINIDLSVGQDYDFLEARVGVRGKITATASGYFLENPSNPGRLHVDQFQGCSLQGSLGVSAGVSLFAEGSLSFDIEAILNTLRNLVEASIKNNPSVFVAKRMLEVTSPYLRDAGVSQADLDNIADAIEDPKKAIQGIVDSLDKVGAPVSENFRDTGDKIASGAKQVGGFISDGADSLGGAISDGYKSVFGLSGTSVSFEEVLFEAPIMEWHTGSCGATNFGGALNSPSILQSTNTTPPVLGTVSNGVLTLFVGPRASDRNVEPTAIDEGVIIRPANPSSPEDGNVVVSMFGATQAFSGVSHIVGDVAAGNNAIDAQGVSATTLFIGGNGADSFFAGLQSSTIFAGDGLNTIVGSPQQDSLSGGNNVDTIIGLGGDDSIFGLGGDDILSGDFPLGSSDDGSSTPLTSGNDRILGGEGNDFLYGGLGNDMIDGDVGNDRLHGGGGSDTIHGGGGHEIIDAGSGDDFVFTGLGDSFIFGGDGADRINAGTGINLLEGGKGDDIIVGGGGSDVFFYADGDGNDSLDGDGGQNALLYDGFTANSSVTLDRSGSGITLSGTSLTDFALNISSIEEFTLSLAGDGSDASVGNLESTSATAVFLVLAESHTSPSLLTLNGSTTSDEVRAVRNGGDVEISGLHAQVTIQNGLSTDRMRINSHAGDDTVKVDSGVENVIGVTLDGGPGNDVLSADAILIGGAGNDLLIGGLGDDQLFGNAGEDTLVGGAGNDTFDGGSGVDTILIEGTGGDDRIDVDQPDSVTLRHAFGLIGIDPTESDTLVAGTIEEARIVAGAGDDQIRITPSESLISSSTEGLSLQFHVDAGAPNASDRLVVVDAGLGDTVVHRIGQVDGSGTVTIGALAPVVYTNVEHMDVTPLNGISGATGIDSSGRLVVFKYDPFENNDSHSSAWHLGGGVTTNVDPTIDPAGDSAFGVPGDSDFFRFVAAETGTLDIQVYFTEVPTLANGRNGLPGDGNLNAVVFDSDGTPGASNPIATGSAMTDSAGNVTGERVVVPVIRNQTYFLRVTGATAEAINSYNFTAVNVTSPVPESVDLVATADSGRSDTDNVTNSDGVTNGPAVFEITLDDDRLDEFTNLNLAPDSADDDLPTAVSDYGVEVFNNGVSIGFAFLQSSNTWRFTATAGDLAEGHDNFLSAAVWFRDVSDPATTGRGALSASLQVTLDTVAPPVSIGLPGNAIDGIDPGTSDTGVNGIPSTIVDRVTRDSTTAFWGRAEADAIVRLYADGSNDDAINTPTQFAVTTALPSSGDEAYPNGQWTAHFIRDLNDPAYFALDGFREILVEAEDVAGNINQVNDATGNVEQSLDIFIDTTGPVVESVFIAPAFDIFDPKPSFIPTPSTNSLDVTFRDGPVRGATLGNHSAINDVLATEVGNFRLVGDASGEIAITSIQLVSEDRNNGVGALATYRLFFDGLLPDDRITLIVSDSITDDAGNRLDGETNTLAPTDTPILPSGDGVPGGSFQARFTVDSRAEIAVYGQGDIKVDINGNYAFDPTNTDAANRDLAFELGLDTDAIFAGEFAAAGTASTNDGFDRLGAYGLVNGSYRWLLDFDNNGVEDYNAVSGLQINGLPIAGNFNGTHPGDEIGLFDGTTWWLDSSGNNNIEAGDTTFTGNMRGLPFVGDFDGDGLDDLGTHYASNNTFYFDLTSAADGTAGVLDGDWDDSFVYGFSGVLERPVAGDMNLDGIDDIALTNPTRDGNASFQTLEWYILVSDASQANAGTVDAILQPANAVPAGTTQTRSFSPAPLGNDLFARFGNNLSAPLLGNFDPPLEQPANVAPEITAPAVFRVAAAQLSATIGVNVSDANGDALNTTARADSLEWYLDQAMGLYDTGNYHQDYFGENEKWIKDADEKWYFITETGGLFRWNGKKSATGTLVATLDASAHEDPTTLTDAPRELLPVNVSVGADGVTVTGTEGFDAPYVVTVTTSDGIESGSATVMIESATGAAARLDRELSFYSNGSYWEDWGGLDEKWFRDESDQWYFITPDGSLSIWARQGGATGTEIAQLDPAFYADPELLLNASEALIDYEYQFKAAASDFFNWSGQQEKWFQDEDNRWFYMLPTGEIFRWTGSQGGDGEYVARVDEDHHSDLDGLYNAVDDVFADWVNLMGL